MNKLDKRYILRLDTKNSIFNTTPIFSLSDTETSDFYIKVSNSNTVIDINNIIAVMVAIDPNGSSYSDFVEIEKAEDGLLYCNLKQELKNVVGTWKARLMLVFGEEKVVTNPFSYKVNNDEFVTLNEDVKTDDRYPVLTDMISSLHAIDTTELQRVKNEELRVNDEVDRKRDENLREVAETLRSNSEENRSSAEILRTTSETSRNNNENTRKTNETNRVNSEKLREAAEQKRATDHTDRETFLNSFESQFEQIETQFKDVVANVTVDSEVISARNGNRTIGERLDKTDSQIKDIENEKVAVFNTVSDMLNSNTIRLNSRCKTLGFREFGDGGGGYYVVTEDTPNGSNILKINNSLSAKLIIEDVVNFKQVGANGWGQNDLLSNYFATLEEAKLTYPNAASLNMTINDVLLKIVLENFKDLYIPEGVYYFNYNISIPSNKNIRGAGNKQTFLKQNTTVQFLTLDGHYISLSDLIIVSNQANKADYGIVINRDRNFNTFNNIIVQYFKTGMRINTNSFLTDLNSVSIFDCTNFGLDVADENNVLNVDKCKINGCGTGIQCISARNINITNSWIELCNIGILKKDKGNLNITDTYFERNTTACVKISWGIAPCELIKINGCSFFTNTSNSLINYHGLATTRLIIENSYFSEYDTNNTITSKIFEKGNSTTAMKPIFKNCFLDGGILIGIAEGDYIV